MVAANDVLAELDRLGLTCEAVDGAALKVHGTRNLTPELRELIRTHKPNILAVLSARAGGIPESPESPGRGAVEEAMKTRVETFRQQVREWREAGHPGVPFLVLFDAIEFGDGACVSCGGPRRPGAGPADMALRCPPCAEAAGIAIEEESR